MSGYVMLGKVTSGCEILTQIMSGYIMLCQVVSGCQVK
jgi:hypothetical protein